tara:strand:+ start:8034 stop:8165 length:132 start_codon:yes stop_codon:yes gene_type:complete
MNKNKVDKIKVIIITDLGIGSLSVDTAIYHIIEPIMDALVIFT